MIVTSEAVELDIVPVGVVSRTLAKVLDIIIQVVAYLIVIAIGTVLFGGGLGWEGAVFLAVMAFLVVLGYPVILESATRGRTVGKFALGLRTVTTEGMPIRFRHAGIRGVFELIDLWLTLGAAGMPAIVWSRQHQRLGDMVAGTMVLREHRKGQQAGMSFSVPPGMEGLAVGLDVAAMPEELYELVRSYLLRWISLNPAARSQVGTTLADRVAATIGFTPTPMVTPDLFLTTAAACYQGRFASEPASPVQSSWSWSPTPNPTPPAPALGPPVQPPTPPAPALGPPVQPPTPPPASDGGGFTPIA